MSQVLAFKRKDEAPEVWMTLEDFCDELAPILGGHRPTVRWLRTKVKDGLPSGVYVNRRLVPRERGLAWLRERKLIP